MISEDATEAFVWIWLPESSKPIVAGRVYAEGDIVNFNYGQSYLEQPGRIAIYDPELPLRRGEIAPLPGLTIPGCIDDASPDAWGRRVIINSLTAKTEGDLNVDSISPLTYLLHSGSNRIGALDFQASAERYVGRDEDASSTLDELNNAAARVDEGLSLSPELDRALLHGSSVGGARPKALLRDNQRQLIAKFSSSTDTYSVVKGEYVAMELANRVGLDVAKVSLTSSMGRDALLVDRFDRIPGTEQRRAIVSALTMLELSEIGGIYASYAKLAQLIRERFEAASKTLAELFARITFNILVGNTDDHARNHAAFWDGSTLSLTPAFDICPQQRSGGEAAQLMAIAPSGWRLSQLEGCVNAAATYLLSESDAREIIDHQIETIHSDWHEVCDIASMTEADRQFFWRRQFMNDFALYGYAPKDHTPTT